MVAYFDNYGYDYGSCHSAALKRFARLVRAAPLPHMVARGFRLAYETSIPRCVGLSGSSGLPFPFIFYSKTGFFVCFVLLRGSVREC